VVNEHDVSGVDDMVSPDYRGSGSEWQHLAPDFKTLREFYNGKLPNGRTGASTSRRPSSLANTSSRAYAHGTEAFDDNGAPRRPPFPTAVEWLAAYHVVGGKIHEGRVITWVVRSES
jgi:hypothetical protein